MIGALEIIKTLKDQGFEAYIVGGWVRDKILGNAGSDIDIATDAAPLEVFELFNKEGIRVIPTGLGHGTVTVIHQHINSDSSYEVTTFRRDVETNGRHAKVEFSRTIEEDLKRRDFTINAIAYDPLSDTYIDPYNGRADIENRIIRCVGNAEERFEEDHLRMLRALRFRATLGFEIDGKTWGAIKKNAGKIENISKERIKMEFDKCFAKADCPSDMIEDMLESGLLKHIMPELMKCVGFLQNRYHKWDVFIHTMIALDAIPKEYPLIRWAALFHDLGKPDTCQHYGTPDASFHSHEVLSEKLADAIMQRLRFSTHDRQYVNTLVRNHMFAARDEMTDSAIRRLVSKVGPENIDALCILKYGDRVGNGTKTVTELNIQATGLRRRFDAILEKENAFKVRDLNITGHDVMEALDIQPGPMVGKVMNYLLEQVLENPSLNNKDNLINLIKEF